MLNGITYGSTKFNSLPIREVIPPTPSVGDTPRKVKRRKFKKQLFNLIGTKLIFCKEKKRIRGTPLSLTNRIFALDKQVAYPLKQNFEVFGKGLKSNRIQIPVSAKKLFKDDQTIALQAKKLFGIKASYDVCGKSLINSIFIKHVAGKKKFFAKNKSHIVGKKDITNILTSLDLFDEE